MSYDCISGGPHFEADLFAIPGRLGRLCKGGDKGASREAEQARLQAQRQHEENMRQLRKQARVAANASSPQFTPAAPPAAANVDTLEAAMKQRRRSQRRFGYTSTRSETLGASSVLGSAG